MSSVGEKPGKASTPRIMSSAAAAIVAVLGSNPVEAATLDPATNGSIAARIDALTSAMVRESVSAGEMELRPQSDEPAFEQFAQDWSDWTDFSNSVASGIRG